jgi:hypothetical protein
MRTIFEARGCSVIYNLLRSLGGERPFLLPSNVCPIVPVTFLKAGRAFRFVDIAEPDLVINRDRCLELLKKDPDGFAGLLFVRTYGAEDDEDEFFCHLKEVQPELLIIDDKCLCRPDGDGINLTRVADVTLFSSGHSKYVDLGFGGFAYLNERVKYQRQGGLYSETALSILTDRYKAAGEERRRFEVPDEAWLDLSQPDTSWDDYRNQLQSALKQADEQKRRLNAIYSDALPSSIQLARKFQSWRFNVRLPQAKQLVARLFQAQLFASRHYQSVNGLFCDERFAVAERLHNEVVNLFNDRYYDESRARRTTEIIIEHLQEL